MARSNWNPKKHLNLRDGNVNSLQPKIRRERALRSEKERRYEGELDIINVEKARRDFDKVADHHNVIQRHTNTWCYHLTNKDRNCSNKNKLPVLYDIQKLRMNQRAERTGKLLTD